MKPSKRLGIAAGVANFFIWGSGYLIVGKRRVFGVLVLAAWGLYYSRYFVPSQATYVVDLDHWLALAFYYLLRFAFAIDAYLLGSSEENVSTSDSV